MPASSRSAAAASLPTIPGESPARRFKLTAAKPGLAVAYRLPARIYTGSRYGYCSSRLASSAPPSPAQAAK